MDIKSTEENMSKSTYSNADFDIFLSIYGRINGPHKENRGT